MSTVTTTSTLIEGLTSEDLRRIIREEIALALEAHNAGTPQQGADTSELLTRREAANYLRISVPSLQRRIRDKGITFVRMGARVLFRREDLDACLRRNSVGSDDGGQLRLLRRRSSRRTGDRPLSRTSR